MPIFMAREWFRHTVGFSRNEVSRRYVDSKPELWIPTIKDLRARDANLKQGSKNTVVENADKIADSLRLVSEKSIEMYESLLSMNVAPEIARVMLPQSMYTEFIETASLAAYARLIGLRTDPTAQKEIRMYADVLSALLEVFFPVSLPALLQTGSI
jgi:thymidylate synthase (FAD)